MAAQSSTIFTSDEAGEFWGDTKETGDALGRLEQGGWLHRLQRGVYLIIPFEAGAQRRWSAQALVIAPYLIEPAAIAYWSALHHWQLTEQIPSTVFVQSTKRKRPSEKTILGMTFRFITVNADKFYGIAGGTTDGQPYTVTDREKTIVDAADRPDLSGGIRQLAQALDGARNLDWALLSDYLLRFPLSSPIKRIGFLVEALQLSVPNRDVMLQTWQKALAPGIVLLEPGSPKAAGQIITRWQVRINVLGPWDARGQS